MSDTIKIEPIKLKEFDVKQSRYDVAPKIPFRSVILGPLWQWQNDSASEHDLEHLQELLQ